MAGSEKFQIGPLGYMKDLPSPAARPGVEVTPRRLGGTFESINGRTTVDIFGQTREWVFTWPMLTKTQENMLRSLYSISPIQDLRFIDPFLDNQLTPDASTGGSISKTSDHFLATAGTYSRILIVTPVLADSFIPDIDSAIQWVVPASTAAVLYADDTVYYRTPIRDTRPLYLKWLATGQGTVQATIKPYNKAGIALTVQTGSSVVLDGTWKEITYTYTPTAGSHYSFAAGVTKASVGSQQTLLITAGQINDVASVPWSLGEGIGPVIVSAFDRKYKHYTRRFEIKFSVQEAA